MESVEAVCNHYKVTVAAVNSKSRKREYVEARQVAMFMAQKLIKMPASRVGKLIGNRDHSTVIHSCAKVEERLKIDAEFFDELSQHREWIESEEIKKGFLERFNIDKHGNLGIVVLVYINETKGSRISLSFVLASFPFY